MTTTQDIIGRECINYERLIFDSCRLCYGRDYRCPNYLARQTKPYRVKSDNSRETLTDDSIRMDKPAEKFDFPNATYHAEVKDERIDYSYLLGHQTIKEPILPKSKAYMIIREWNDRGCI